MSLGNCSDPSAYVNCDEPNFGTGAPSWLNKGDNAWQMTAATLVGLQSVPGLVILYGSYVKKKWAVNSAFMALYGFAATLIFWVLFAYKLAFGEKLLPFWGKAGGALYHQFLITQSGLPATATKHVHIMGDVYSQATNSSTMYYPMATMVYFQFVFAAITIILLGGSLLGRMNIFAWYLFVPLWLVFSYTVSAFSIWGGGFLYQQGVLDYSGGYVIHVSSGVAGLTAAFWVGPRLKTDRDQFPPNSILLMLAGAGLVWLGWSGFNGGDPYAANIDASLAVLNTHICAATSLMVWLFLDMYWFEKPSVIGAIQGMITGLVCITPAAGLVESWAAIIMGILSGSIPWYTMNVIHKKSKFLLRIDDTMAVFHTHAVAGALGGLCVGAFANPVLVNLFFPIQDLRGLFYFWHGHHGFMQGLKQIGWQAVGILFVSGWNVVVTSIICQVIKLVVPLRMSNDDLETGDDAVHGEEAYAVWGDGVRIGESLHGSKHRDSNIGSDFKSENTSEVYHPGMSPGSSELTGIS